jgi:hydrogenase maturation protein HypF
MTSVAPPATLVRRRIRVDGVVQGVGYRPFVYRLATDLALTGHVGNDTAGVFIEVEGPLASVEDFQRRLTADAPPLAHVFHQESCDLPVTWESGFAIVESRSSPAARTFVSPDIALCADCLAELFDPTDRRYRYPFINCTNCGPRFTITIRLPYDRPNTTMARFKLCSACTAEYDDPRDRRYHAQPVACPDCGPQLRFEGGSRESFPESALDPIAAAQRALASGDVVAIKGIGGYHLSCSATSDAAVAQLRARKHRLDKPFAVMVRDVGVARTLAVVSEAEEQLLMSGAAPIVLLQKRARTPLSDLVAPGNPQLGVLLPYTPLHHLLFASQSTSLDAPEVLVMTSGNLTDEPICFDDQDARRRLAGIADAWLIHDRPIHVPCDDSVVRVVDGEELPIRRSRGFAPLPVRLPFPAAETLAVGAELKNTFCLASGRDAWMSQHIGDMGSLETLAAFAASTEQFAEIYQVHPVQAAIDAHPGYQTRRWAEESSGLPLAAVQHHHAHIASVMAEHGVPASERVIGFAFDGTGFGTDGAIWGGEVLLADYGDFDRAAHLRYSPLPGGDAAVRKPYRAALAQLWSCGLEWDPALPPVEHAQPDERRALLRQLERNVQCVPTSSMGRLFDAVSSLLGLRHVASFEAQAAMELEWVAARHDGQPRRYDFTLEHRSIDPTSLLASLTDDVLAGCPVGAMAVGFHHAVATMMADLATDLRLRHGPTIVALSGGVFQNVLLSRLAVSALKSRGFTVLTHRVVPPNDGGLALGQAAVAGYRFSPDGSLRIGSGSGA